MATKPTHEQLAEVHKYHAERAKHLEATHDLREVIAQRHNQLAREDIKRRSPFLVSGRTLCFWDNRENHEPVPANEAYKADRLRGMNEAGQI